MQFCLPAARGSRFWPQSRTLEPKQFLSLHKDKSLFEQTIIRILRLIPPQNIFIATSELYRSQISEIIRPYCICSDNIVYEPDGRNTAASIGVCAQLIHCRDPKSRIAVLPCDHLVKNKARFLQLLRKAFALCDEKLVIFGIPPERPATGYGYIQRGSGMAVRRFTEKPSSAVAKRFLASGDYYWNSGIFVGSGNIFLKEFGEHLPEIARLIAQIHSIADITKVWNRMPSISFDYGILEKTKNISMIVGRGLGWSDLGSWQAWDELLPKDKQGNAMKADVVNIGSKNITVVGSNRLIATIGLEGLVIVDTPDALLITKKDKTEDVKKVVENLKANKRQEHYVHKTARRPWGSYTVLDMGDGFKVKQVEVKPGCALSLQYHKKRSEHWVVVEGKAKIVRGKRSYIFGANQSTYIPVGCRHRLCNPSPDRPLKIIEVQAGRYLEEDDIVRLKDDFGRIK